MADIQNSRRPEALRRSIIELMRATRMPNGLTALGFGDAHVAALAKGAEPQCRVIKNAPIDVDQHALRDLSKSAMRYW
jgi:alcohol dehydrogenase class IV